MVPSLIHNIFLIVAISNKILNIFEFYCVHIALLFINYIQIKVCNLTCATALATGRERTRRALYPWRSRSVKTRVLMRIKEN